METKRWLDVLSGLSIGLGSLTVVQEFKEYKVGGSEFTFEEHGDILLGLFVAIVGILGIYANGKK